MYTREFYFHIRGGDRLNVTRADTHPLWKDIPEVTSQDKHYHTIQCAEVTKEILMLNSNNNIMR